MIRNQKPSVRSRAAFTLVELLIVTGILLLLAAMTVATYSSTTSADRIRASARQIQSSVGGAKDRAIKAARTNRNVTRGVRLLRDPNSTNIVTSLVFVGSDPPTHQGHIQVGRMDDDSNGVVDDLTNPIINRVRGYGTNWKQLRSQGLIGNVARMRIKKHWYWVDATLLDTVPLVDTVGLISPYLDDSGSATMGTYDPPNLGVGNKPGVANFDDDGDLVVDNTEERYWPGSDDTSDINPLPPIMADFASFQNSDFELVLLPSVLPGQEPMQLSSGIAIDLANSRPIPSDPATPIDLMFTGDGNMVGTIAAQGPIHLRLASVEDIANGLLPDDPQASLMMYCSVFPQTGFVGAFPVGPTSDPFYFARIGGTAGR